MNPTVLRSPDNGILGSCDAARLAQQEGIYPPPHAFEPLPPERGWPPTLCGYQFYHRFSYGAGLLGCYATVEANKPWHMDAA